LSDLTDKDDRRRRLQRRAFGILGTFPGPPGLGDSRLSPPGPGRTPAEATPPDPSAADDALALRIKTKAASLAQDLFAILGVPRTATREQIKLGYLQSVKLFHPDRLPPSLSRLTSQVEDIFRAVRNANDTLQDDARRAVYLQSLCEPAGAVGPTTSSGTDGMDALALEKQAELHLRKGEYAEAAQGYGKAFGLSKSPGHLAQQAWSIHLDPERKGELATVKQMLDQAMKLDQLCDKAAYVLGVLARVGGDLAKAEKYFRIAIAGNPRHAEAATELRLIARRRRQG
jgi:curved DNA-binding protein CbpA